MNKLVTAHYSKKTGRRVSNAFAERNPNYVTAVALDPEFLRGMAYMQIGHDGMPANLDLAQKAKASWDVKQTKLAHRRAQYKVKKLKKAAAVVADYGKKVAAIKKRAKKANKPAVGLPAIPAALF